ncbi:ATP-binding cassette domain-containing protein [Furfurilactobacillus entadae]|uniref:ATP-binding cassette domain-containing protein n=1 Tax=Furfurilactobacillus entadae TaxID=2922307 RepID=UPI0035E6547A
MEIQNFSYQLPSGVSLYDHLSVHFSKDNVNVIFGPNGIGKTTLLDFIAGVNQRPVENFVDFPAGDEIAYQLQGVPFIGEATVFNTMKLIAEIENPREKFTVSDLPDELKRFVDVQFRQLSGGQRRLVIIEAVSRLERTLYLFDEPESGLDPKMARQVMMKLKALNQRGKMVIATSHQFQNIDDMFNLIFLNAGKILFTGSAKEFLAAGQTNDLVEAYLKRF